MRYLLIIAFLVIFSCEKEEYGLEYEENEKETSDVSIKLAKKVASNFSRDMIFMIEKKKR